MGGIGFAGSFAGFSFGDGGPDEGLDEVAGGFQLVGEEGALAGGVIDGAVLLPAFEAMLGAELVVEFVAGELELLAAVFVLGEADENGGREVGMPWSAQRSAPACQRSGVPGGGSSRKTMSSSRRGKGWPSGALAVLRR